MYFTMCEQMCYSRKNRLAAVTDRVETLLLNSLWMTAEHFCASVTVNVNASSSGQNGRSRSSASVINALNETRSTHKTIWCERTDHRSSLSFCLTSPFFQRLLCVLCRSPEEPFGTAGARLFTDWSGCPCCHQSNSVKALKEHIPMDSIVCLFGV